MKKLLLILLILIGISTQLKSQTKVQTALYVRGGYSWLTGVIGTELQINNFGFGFGWMPTPYLLNDQRINAYGIDVTYYNGLPNQNSFYISGSYIINGYEYESDYYGTQIIDMMAILIGYKVSLSIFDLKFGLGTGFNSDNVIIIVEATIGLNIFDF